MKMEELENQRLKISDRSITCKDENGKTKGDPEESYVAFAVSASGCENLVWVLDHIGGLVSANVCNSRKEAEEIARAWNETYKKNGTYFYNREMIPAKEA